MDSAMDTPYSLASFTYNSWGEAEKASMYATIAISYGIYIHGPEWETRHAHTVLQKEPHKHWSYRTRLQKAKQDD